ncbi:serine/threonine-protein kinase [Kitasatospora sp. NPDC096147]|uniref:serine/threonine-protein kinase n=1 Tax=Kitasatospora sp. NPDC096147 TaxID=3364093 RepID=UPI003804BD45
MNVGGGADGAVPSADAATRRLARGRAAGRLVGGRYRLLERLGAGGMGTVWRARDEVVDRDVALKEPRVPEDCPAEQRRTVFARMEREARAAARIDHPSVVTIHDVVSEDGRPWIVMELVRGRSLAEALEEGTLAPPEAARIGLAVLGALTAAHEAGVVHRDVKPANVLLGRHERVVLTDFGIAKMDDAQALTEPGTLVGSPEYLAPERVLGRRSGPEADLWSLGVTLYAAVEGVSPFRRQTTPATLQAVLLGELPAPHLAGGLTEVLIGLLRKEPEARVGAPAAQAALRAFLAPAASPPPTVVVVPDGGPGAAPMPAGRRGLAGRLSARRAVVAGIAALAAVGAVAGLVAALNSDSVPRGWRVYDEYRMRLKVAAPGDWSAVVVDNLDKDRADGPYRGTRYIAPGGDSWMTVDRLERTTETPLAIANRWKREHEAGSPPAGGLASAASVTGGTEQGRDAAVITETYSQSAKGAPRRLFKTLIIVTSHQERLTICVDVPDGKDAAAKAETLLAAARSGYQISGL